MNDNWSNHFYNSTTQHSHPAAAAPTFPDASLAEQAVHNYSAARSTPRQPLDDQWLAKELRDQGLTWRQREANQRQSRATPSCGPMPPRHLGVLLNQTPERAVDALVGHMLQALNGTTFSQNTMSSASSLSSSSSSVCAACGEGLSAARPGCTALDRIYHVACFCCNKCGKQLAGTSFYNLDGVPICEADYQNSLEKCSKCSKTIVDRMLRACGGTFHVACFVCHACNKALDGIPFTTDGDNHVFCVPCFQEKFAPRCAACQRPIVPGGVEQESVRVMAMDKSYHLGCYRCEDCKLALGSKAEGGGCYPLDGHLYCKKCNQNRLRLASSAS